MASKVLEFGLAAALLGMPAAVLVQRTTLNRTPLQADPVVLRAPTSYSLRATVDAKTGQQVQYDPKPDVVETDSRLGLYELRWIGYDGKLKSIVYQRPDKIDVIVNASVQKGSDGRYSYTYRVNNLRTSAESLSGFVVQALSPDLTAVESRDVFSGRMGATPPFTQGVWIRFAPVGPTAQVPPGRSFEYRAMSSSSPGLVECRVHGGQVG